MRKGLKRFAFLLIAMLSLPLLTVSAYTPKQLSQYAKEISEAEEWKLEGQVELTRQEISTIHNGAIESDVVWNNHTVQWLSVGKNSAVKPVVWSVGTAENWKATNLDNAITDYEAHHPGYIVVGAVNGDFFDNSVGGTGEPTNYHVQDGDVLRAAKPGATYRGVLGFGDNNKEYVAVFGQSRSSSMYLKVLENGKATKELEVVTSNTAPSASGLSVYTKQLSETVDLTGYTVYEGAYVMYREYSGGYFLKGSITKVSDVTSLTSVDSGKFYVASKEAVLAAGTDVKVEYNLAGELAGVQSAVGFIHQVLKDGVPQYANAKKGDPGNGDGFIDTTHPRTLVGFKEDGSIVLMVIDGRGTTAQNLEGASLFQCGELLRLAGCVDGYNLDGGGSSTLMARINGEMTLINNPSDARQSGQPWGTLRSTGNAVLLVMKDPKLTIDNPVGNTITVRKTGEVVDGTLQNVKVKIDNKEYDLTGDELVITGLKTNMEYMVSYSYEILNEDGTIEKGSTHEYALTTEDYAFPELKEFSEYELGEGSVTLKYKIEDDDEVIKAAYIQNGNTKTTLEKLSGRVTIDGLDTKVANNFVLVIELENGKVIELGKVSYEANTIPSLEGDVLPPDDSSTDQTKDEESGCKKDVSAFLVSMIGLSSLLVVVKKKRQ